MASPPSGKQRVEQRTATGFNPLPGLAGLWVGLALLKFGNPVILDKLVESPHNLAELWVDAWPAKWGFGFSALFLVAAVFWRDRPRPRLSWLLVLPGVWLGWQFLAAAGTVDPALTRITMVHFFICVLSFYAGFFCLGQKEFYPGFLLPVLLAFCWMLWNGFDQHYGGLEATRKAFYEQPDWQSYPPEYLKKIASDRIFATLVYPNALAGAINLFLPLLGWGLWNCSRNLPRVARGVLTGLFVYAGLACLFWSGSKAGWLIALVVVLALVLRLNFSQKIKVALIAVVLLGGISAFAIKFNAYFKRGATSASARLIYWKAAVQIANTHPMLGTGPGTFSRPFKDLKPEGAEMARLTHNDYLEQACDSGWPGFLAYLGFISGGLALSFRKTRPLPQFLLWVGLLSWALHATVEFELYIPALSWPVFLLLGWLLARPSSSD